MEDYGALLQACAPAMAGFGPDVLNATEPVPREKTAQLAAEANPSPACCDILKAWWSAANWDRWGVVACWGLHGECSSVWARACGSAAALPPSRGLRPATLYSCPLPPTHPPLGRCACDPELFCRKLHLAQRLRRGLPR